MNDKLNEFVAAAAGELQESVVEKLERENGDLRWSLASSWKELQKTSAQVCSFQSKNEDLLSIANTNHERAVSMARENNSLQLQLDNFRQIYPLKTLQMVKQFTLRRTQNVLMKVWFEWRQHTSQKHTLHQLIRMKRKSINNLLIRNCWNGWKLHVENAKSILLQQKSQMQLQSFGEMKVAFRQKQNLHRCFSGWKSLLLSVREMQKVQLLLSFQGRKRELFHSFRRWQIYLTINKRFRCIINKRKRHRYRGIWKKWKRYLFIHQKRSKLLRRLVCQHYRKALFLSFFQLRLHAKNLLVSDWLQAVMSARQALYEEKERWTDTRNAAVLQVERTSRDLYAERERFQLTQSIIMQGLQQRQLQLKTFLSLKSEWFERQAKLKLVTRFCHRKNREKLNRIFRCWKSVFKCTRYHVHLACKAYRLRELECMQRRFRRLQQHAHWQSHLRRCVRNILIGKYARQLLLHFTIWRGKLDALQCVEDAQKKEAEIKSQQQELSLSWAAQKNQLKATIASYEAQLLQHKRNHALQRLQLQRRTIEDLNSKTFLRHWYRLVQMEKRAQNILHRIMERWKHRQYQKGIQLWTLQTKQNRDFACMSTRSEHTRSVQLKRRIWLRWKQWYSSKLRNSYHSAQKEYSYKLWRLHRKLGKLEQCLIGNLVKTKIDGLKQLALRQWQLQNRKYRQWMSLGKKIVSQRQKNQTRLAFRTLLQFSAIVHQKEASFHHRMSNIRLIKSTITSITMHVALHRKRQIFRRWQQGVHYQVLHTNHCIHKLSQRYRTFLLGTCFQAYRKYIDKLKQTRKRLRTILQSQSTRQLQDAFSGWQKVHWREEANAIVEKYVCFYKLRGMEHLQRRMALQFSQKSQLLLQSTFHVWKSVLRARHQQWIRVEQYEKDLSNRVLQKILLAWSREQKQCHRMRRNLQRAISMGYRAQIYRGWKQWIRYDLVLCVQLKAQENEQHCINFRSEHANRMLQRAKRNQVLSMFKQWNQRTHRQQWIKRQMIEMQHHRKCKLEAIIWKTWHTLIQHQLVQKRRLRCLLSRKMHGTKILVWRKWNRHLHSRVQKVHSQNSRRFLLAAEQALHRQNTKQILARMLQQWLQWSRYQQTFRIRLYHLFVTRWKRDMYKRIWFKWQQSRNIWIVRQVGLLKLFRKQQHQQLLQAWRQWYTFNTFHDQHEKTQRATHHLLRHCRRQSSVQAAMLKWRDYLRRKQRWVLLMWKFYTQHNQQRRRFIQYRINRKQWSTLDLHVQLWRQYVRSKRRSNRILARWNGTKRLLQSWNQWMIFHRNQHTRQALLGKLVIAQREKQLHSAVSQWKAAILSMHRRQSVVQMERAQLELQQFRQATKTRRISVIVQKWKRSSCGQAFAGWKMITFQRRHYRVLIATCQRRAYHRQQRFWFHTWHAFVRNHQRIVHKRSTLQQAITLHCVSRCFQHWRIWKLQHKGRRQWLQQLWMRKYRRLLVLSWQGWTNACKEWVLHQQVEEAKAVARRTQQRNTELVLQQQMYICRGLENLAQKRQIKMLRRIFTAWQGTLPSNGAYSRVQVWQLMRVLKQLQEAMGRKDLQWAFTIWRSQWIREMQHPHMCVLEKSFQAWKRVKRPLPWNPKSEIFVRWKYWIWFMQKLQEQAIRMARLFLLRRYWKRMAQRLQNVHQRFNYEKIEMTALSLVESHKTQLRWTHGLLYLRRIFNQMTKSKLREAWQHWHQLAFHQSVQYLEQQYVQKQRDSDDIAIGMVMRMIQDMDRLRRSLQEQWEMRIRLNAALSQWKQFLHLRKNRLRQLYHIFDRKQSIGVCRKFTTWKYQGQCMSIKAAECFLLIRKLLVKRKFQKWKSEYIHFALMQEHLRYRELSTAVQFMHASRQ